MSSGGNHSAHKNKASNSTTVMTLPPGDSLDYMPFLLPIPGNQCKHDVVIHKTRSKKRIATLPEEVRATAVSEPKLFSFISFSYSNMHRKVWTCSS